ncbi:MAG: helix-turn-helix transcriptional regulator, partial [Limnochordia bacterium]
SQYYLSRMFKTVTGLTLIEYLNTIRIQEAQKLLADENLSITEIASLVGYDSQTYFGRMFKRITGLTPREYRKHNLAGGR